MALKKEGKKAIVADIAHVAQEATALVGVRYTGVSVAELTRLRKQARQQGVVVRVVRNTLAARAFEGTPFSCVRPHLFGHLLLAFSGQEPGSAARIIRDFVKANDKCEVKILAVGASLVPSDRLDQVANLPTKLEAIARLMAVMKAPLSTLVATMNAVPTKMVRTVVAIKDQKETV